MRDAAPNAIDRSIAELIRRREQRHVAARDPAGTTTADHVAAAKAYDTAIEVLRACRDADGTGGEASVE